MLILSVGLWAFFHWFGLFGCAEGRGQLGGVRGGMTPLEREMAVLRRAEMAAHKFGTAFYPYTEALGAERAARPPTSDGFRWSAGWLRPSPAEVVAPLSLEGREASYTEQRPAPQQGAGAGAGARTPPSVPTSVVAAVKRQHSPRVAASESNGSLPRRPPPITAARRSLTSQHSAEEGIPRDEVEQTTGGIEEGIPPDGRVRQSATVRAALSAPAAAAS